MPGERMWFTVLGPVRAWHADREIDLGAPQQRALLAVLLVQAGQPVSLADIVDAMWGQDPPGSAVNAVHRSVGMLRRALQPELATRDAGRWLIRSAGGYRLDAGADAVDLLRFRLLVAEARSAAVDRSAAADRFGQALALWQGPVASGIGSQVRGHPLFAAAEREYLAAARDAADAALAGDELGRLLDAVARAADHGPLDEALQARLVLLLAAAGNQAGALALFRKVRDRLADELGLDPGDELTAARDRVLRQSASAAPVSSRPPATATPRSTTGVHPAQLPADLATFTGRRAELAEALALHLDAADAPGVAVISAIGGTAGIGKTTLAVHWAHQVAHRYPDGQLYLNLRGFDPSGQMMSSTDALQAMLAALGAAREEIPSGTDARAALYRSLVAARRILILLDNARDAEQVRPLLPGSPGCLVIVTSRNQLSSLVATHSAHLLTLDLMTPGEAHDFLARRLGAARVTSESGAVDDIVAHCAGLPLALAIVAARAVARPALPLAAIVAEIRQARGSLDAFSGADPAIDTRSVFSWSYHALSDEAARLFRLLGVPAGPDITVAAAASLAAQPRPRVAHLLAELTKAHLIVQHRAGRYAFHDLLRTYAMELAVGDSDERDSALHRLLDHYLQSAVVGATLIRSDREPLPVAPPSDGVLPEAPTDVAAAVEWLAVEEANLLSAIELSNRLGLDRFTWQLSWTIASNLGHRVPEESALSLLRTAVYAAGRLNDPAAYARALNGLASASVRCGRLDDAYTYFEQARQVSIQLSDTAGEARAEQNLAYTRERQGRYREALDHIHSALALTRTIGDRSGEGRALGSIGWLLSQLGEHRDALVYCRKALTVQQELGATESEAAQWHSIGYAHHHLGEYPNATVSYRRSLELCRRLGDVQHEVETLNDLGDTLAAAGDHASARAVWQQALTTLDGRGHRHAKSIRAKLDA